MRRTALVLTIAALAGVGVGAALALSRSSRASASSELHAQIQWKAGSRKAPGFTLVDQRGVPFSLAAARGRPVLLTFLDSRCKGMCPLEARELAAIRPRTPAGAAPLLVVVSVDPWADTPRSERAFAARARWSLPWRWLGGSVRALRPVWRRYGIDVKPTRTDVFHSTGLYLIDRDGYERAGYLPPFSGSDVSSDLQTLSE